MIHSDLAVEVSDTTGAGTGLLAGNISTKITDPCLNQD